MSETRRGCFLVLDGPEGAGKTTQVKRLVRRIEGTGRAATAVHDPGGPPVAQRVRELLLQESLSDMGELTEVLLFMAARAELVGKVIWPAMQTGVIVVGDRFTSSTVAYQGYAGGVDPKRIWEISAWACAGLEPDLTIILDLDVRVGFKRIHGSQVQWDGQLDFGFFRDRMETRPTAYHEKVRQGFLSMAEARPQVFAVVDASQPPDAVAEAIWEAAKRVL